MENNNSKPIESKTKQIVASGKMSQLVGMWASIWDGDNLKYTVYILGKADDSVYIVQAIDALSGETNVAKLVELKDMFNWIFYPTKEIAEFCLADYDRHEKNRYDLKL